MPSRLPRGVHEVYVLPGGSIAPVLSQVGWCPVCKTLSRAELIPSDAIISDLLSQRAKMLRNRSPAKKDPVDPQWETLCGLYVAAEGEWRNWARQRRGREPQCLQCRAGSMLLLFDDDEQDEEDVKQPNVRDPNCGAPMRWESTHMHVMWNKVQPLRLSFRDAEGRSILEGEAGQSRSVALLGEGTTEDPMRVDDALRSAIRAARVDRRFAAIPALRWFQLEIAASGDVAHGWNVLGETLRDHSVDAAIEFWESAMRCNPADQAARQALTAAYCSRRAPGDASKVAALQQRGRIP